MESAWRQVQAPSMTSTSSHQPITDAGMWSSEYLDTVDTSLTKSSGTQNWADDFMEQQDNYGMENTWKDAQAFEQRWEEIKRDMEKDESLQSPENYVYQVRFLSSLTHFYNPPIQEANPFTTMSDPLMEGDNLMRNGDIGNAMLAYEAAVQKDPQDARAWCKLGLAHAENEKDQLAMQAFQKCLQIDAGNKEVKFEKNI